MPRFSPLPLLAFACLALSLTACSDVVGESDLSGPGTERLQIHLQASFNGERVRVDLDGTRVFDEIAHTDPGGVAEVITLELPQDLYRVRVDVESGLSAERRFFLEVPLYVGVEFYRDSGPSYSEGLHIGLSERPFIYE